MSHVKPLPIYMSLLNKILLIAVFPILVTACGGGGGGDDGGSTTNSTANNTADTVAPDSPGLSTSSINLANVNDYSFRIFAAEIGTTALWRFTDDSGATITGSSPVTLSNPTFNGINVSSLNDGPIIFTLILEDNAGNQSSVSSLLNKDSSEPTNYQLTTSLTSIDSSNQTEFSFSLETVPQNVGSAYLYTIEGSEGSSISSSGFLSSEIQEFNLIDVSALALGNVVVTILLTDNNGNAGEPETLSILKSSVSSSISVTGTVTFDFVPHNEFTSGLNYFGIFDLPARGVEVILLDTSNSVLETSTTDDLGHYQFDAPINTDVRVRVNARLLSTVAPTWDTSITDNTNNNAMYAMQGALLNTGASSSVRNLHAASGWTGTGYGQARVAAPFAILDVAYEALQQMSADNTSFNFPSLEIRWSENNISADGLVSEGDIGNSHFDPQDGNIYLLGKADTNTDEYDRHVIAHEWCHYFEDRLSVSDNLGGSHFLGDRTDMTLAHSEGMCNALAGIVLGDSVFRNSSGPEQSGGFDFDMEENTISNPGWYNEISIGAIIYDIYDSSSDGVDAISESLSSLPNVLTSNDYTSSNASSSIYLFLSVLKDGFASSNPSKNSIIDDLANAQNIVVNDIFGTAETNNAGDSRVLPIYHQLTVGGGSVEVCSINNFGIRNKLGNYSRARFTIPIADNYSITATRVSGPTNSDPDFYLRDSGSLFILGDSSIMGTKSWSGVLLSGDYSLEVFDHNNTSDQIGANYCFDLEIN